MEEDVVISAEPHLLVCRCRAHDVTVEICLALVGYAQKMGKLVGVGGWIIVSENIAVKGEFAEERSHASGYACHRTEGCEHHRLGMWMLVERPVDAFPVSYFVIFFQNRIPHSVLQGIIHDAIRGNALPGIAERCIA